MKARDIFEAESCLSKTFYSGFSQDKQKNYFNGIVINELFKRKGLEYDNQDVIQIVKDVIPEQLFHTSRESVINTTLLVLRLLRFQEIYNKHIKGNVISNNAHIYKGNKVFVTQHDLEINYNFLIEDNGVVTIYKVKNKLPELKLNGKSKFTCVSENMELYLLQLAAQKEIPNKLSYVAKIVYLRHPDDKGDTLVSAKTVFETKSCIVGTSFSMIKAQEMNERIEDAINGVSVSCKANCEECGYYRLCKYQRDETKKNILPPQAKANGFVQFTDNQLDLISAKKGIFRVLAGAGSGKTTCIANRICTLIKDGVDPDEILLITFTNKGALEMKEKIEYWLKQDGITNIDVHKMHIFTFNSFGFEVLKKEYAKFGYTAEPSLLEQSERIALIKMLLDSHPEISGFNYKDPVLDMPFAKGVVLEMDYFFNIIKNSHLTYVDEVKKACRIKNDEIAEAVLELYLEFTEHMMKNNLVDYSDQINLCLELFSNDPWMIEKYGFAHIMVDEFQDSDAIQINMLMKMSMCTKFQSLMVVGDDSQGIFSFRGATPHNIIHFHEVFPTTIDIPLMENFRSTVEICELANKINDINKDKIPKNLITKRQGNIPVMIHAISYADFVDNVMQAMMYFGYDFKNISIIARNKKDLIEIQKELLYRCVPNVIAVNELMIDNQEVQHMIDFAKYLQDKNASLMFAEYLQVADYENYKLQNKTSIKNYVEAEKQKFEAELDAQKTEKERLEFIFSKFEEVGKIHRGVESLCKVLKTKNFNTVYDFAQFLIDMELYKSDYMIEKIEEPLNCVTLTTAHSSKGREWDFVAIYLPSFSYPSNVEYLALKNTPTFEEERRLLFVAITRAKENLILIGDSQSSIYQEVLEANVKATESIQFMKDSGYL